MIELTRENGEQILITPRAIVMLAPSSVHGYPNCKTAVTFESGKASIVEYVRESIPHIIGLLP